VGDGDMQVEGTASYRMSGYAGVSLGSTEAVDAGRNLCIKAGGFAFAACLCSRLGPSACCCAPGQARAHYWGLILYQISDKKPWASG
jgi:hypothetical protein